MMSPSKDANQNDPGTPTDMNKTAGRAKGTPEGVEESSGRAEITSGGGLTTQVGRAGGASGGASGAASGVGVRRMQKLRQDRAWSHPDRSLAFMAQAFKKDVERPYKQLGDLATLWAELLPSELVEHTRLESLSRGVLRVIVDSAARHFELDGLLRQGLLTELIKQHRGPAFRRVQLRVGTLRS